MIEQVGCGYADAQAQRFIVLGKAKVLVESHVPAIVPGENTAVARGIERTRLVERLLDQTVAGGAHRGTIEQLKRSPGMDV